MFRRKEKSEQSVPVEQAQATAAHLKLFTTPFRRSESEQDESKLSADEYWQRHPELAAERHKHDHAVIREQAAKQVQAAVLGFIESNPGYLKSDDNSRRITEWLEARKLPPTRINLQAVFDALKDKLAMTADDAAYGATRFVDYGVLRDAQTPQIPIVPQRIEIIEKTKRITLQDIRRMSARQYDEALKNPSMREQIEALLSNS